MPDRQDDPGVGQAVRGMLKGIGIGVIAVALLVCVFLGFRYKAAIDEIETAMADGTGWVDNGRVLSAPWSVWPDLKLDAEGMAMLLEAAGYARVDAIARPGEFTVRPDKVVVSLKAARTPGGAVPKGEVMVRFGGDTVLSVEPEGAVFPPVALGSVMREERQARKPVSLERVPEHVVNAFLAAEDARFFNHVGLDAIGIARALMVNMATGEPVQGGSTLTQQLVKNLFLSHERTLERKTREALLAVAMERVKTKEEILELYLNEVYLGNVDGVAIHGVGQAARTFFGKPVDRLSIAEAATLAGLVPAPNPTSPVRHPEKAIEKRNLVLDRMVEVGSLPERKASRLKREPLTVQRAAIELTTGGPRAPWVVDAAVERVEEALGEGAVANGGLQIHTTIHPVLQQLAQDTVSDGMDHLSRQRRHLSRAQAALVAIRVEDGSVLALVGGRDHAESPFNRAVDARRHLGSTVKPLIYATVFEHDRTFSPATRLEDSPLVRDEDTEWGWSPENYDGEYRGMVSARDALVHSRNIPAVHAAERVGMKTLQRTWKSLGLDGATAYRSAALGAFPVTPLQLAGAFTVFPGRGSHHPPRLVVAAIGSKGRTRFSEPEVAESRFSRRAAFLSSELMEDVINRGTGTRAKQWGLEPGRVAGKTGTTDDTRDAWFVGYDAELVAVAWVGFDQNAVLGLTGGEAALPLWSSFMADAATSTRSLPGAPPDVETATICTSSGMAATAYCPSTMLEWFNAGASPIEPCPYHGEDRAPWDWDFEEGLDDLKDLVGLSDADRQMRQERREARRLAREEARQEEEEAQARTEDDGWQETVDGVRWRLIGPGGDRQAQAEEPEEPAEPENEEVVQVEGEEE